MKHLFMILLCSWFGMLSAVAQKEYRVTGRVETLNGETLPGAHVKLTDAKHSDRMIGASTDAAGTFSIPVSKGLYQLEISFVGYVTYVSNVEVEGDVHLPPVALGEDAQLMDEVVVTARTITYNPNGYIAEISKNPFYQNQDMSVILRMTPGTDITINSVKAYGKDISKIYLNGRELHLNGQELINYLQTIEGKNVKRMELVAASGVEESAASAGRSILKITTANLETGGMFAGGGLGNYSDHNHLYGGNMNLQWRINSKWGMYARLSRNDRADVEGSRSEIHFYDTGDKQITETGGDRDAITYMATFGLSYDWNENNLFSIEGLAGSLFNAEEQKEEDRRWNGLAYEKLANGASVGESDVDYLNLSFLYLHKFGKEGELAFKAETYQRKDEEWEDRTFAYASGEKQDISRVNESDNSSYTLMADYTHDFPSVKGKLAAGVKALWLENDNFNDNLFLVNGEKELYGSYTDHYVYKEQVYAAYAKYDFAWKKFRFNAGLRMEHSVVSPESAVNPERNVKSDDTSFFPEVGVNYAISQEKGHQTGISYQKGIVRPHTSDLNPMVVRQGEYSYYEGNPLLKAYHSHNLSWNTHLFHQYIVRLTYRYSDGNIFSLSENRDGLIYRTLNNGGKSSVWDIYVSAPMQIGKNVRLTFEGSYSQHYEAYGDDERRFNRWYVGCSGMFRLPAGFQLMASFAYNPPLKSLYGTSYRYPLANLILSKSFLKGKLNATLRSGDLFNHTNCSHDKYYYDSYYREIERGKRSLGVTLNVRYNIRWGQKSDVKQAGSSNGDGRF